MTYKKIVMEMLRQDAKEWVTSLFKEKNVEYTLAFTDTPYIEVRKDDILYSVKVTVITPDAPSPLNKKEFEVGGCADDLIGISHSVIWDASGKNILWMDREDARDTLGITEFRIA